GLEKPLARHRRVPHQQSRTAGPHLRRVHVGNSRTRPSPADRGHRTDCRDQAGPHRPCSRQSNLNPRKRICFAWSRSFMPDIQIKILKSSPQTGATLSEMLVEAVTNGGSVSFMHPLPLEAANAFWRDSLASADRGDRIVLGAFDGEDLIGTVTLVLNLAQNQPHRAEIVKMMTRVSHRHRGIATLLLREAERMAIARGRWLLVLDTAEDEGAAGLYERMGFKLTGVIPDYALKPH